MNLKSIIAISCVAVLATFSAVAAETKPAAAGVVTTRPATAQDAKDAGEQPGCKFLWGTCFVYPDGTHCCYLHSSCGDKKVGSCAAKASLSMTAKILAPNHNRPVAWRRSRARAMGRRLRVAAPPSKGLENKMNNEQNGRLDYSEQELREKADGFDQRFGNSAVELLNREAPVSRELVDSTKNLMQRAGDHAETERVFEQRERQEFREMRPLLVAGYQAAPRMPNAKNCGKTGNAGKSGTGSLKGVPFQSVRKSEPSTVQRHRPR